MNDEGLGLQYFLDLEKEKEDAERKRLKKERGDHVHFAPTLARTHTGDTKLDGEEWKSDNKFTTDWDEMRRVDFNRPVADPNRDIRKEGHLPSNIGGKRKSRKIIRKTRKAKKSTRSKKSKKTRSKKKEFLYNPNDPSKSFDVYIDKNPSDTIPIKYTTVKDVRDTISKLERLYKNKKYPHKRIWQVGMIMKVRLEAMKKHKKTRYPNAKNVTARYNLANKYFKKLGKRSKELATKRRTRKYKH